MSNIDPASTRRPVESTVDQKLSVETIFVYSRNKYYSEQWLKQQNGEALGLNIWAALLGPTWCFTKKLLPAGLMLAASYFLIAWLLVFLIKSIAGISPLVFISCYMLAIFGMQLAFGKYANALYLKLAVAEITEIIQARLPNAYFLAAIKKKGDFTLPGLILALAMGALFRILSVQW